MPFLLLRIGYTSLSIFLFFLFSMPLEQPAGTSFYPENLTVNTTANDGPGSLRNAIDFASANPGPDTIVFNIQGTPPFVIAPTGAALVLSLDNAAGTVIDATTQPDYYPGSIQLDGSNYSNQENGLSISVPDCEVYGLLIRHFPAAGIQLGPGSDHFKIGDANRGNIINGCFEGILVSGANHGFIKANKIGTDADGMIAIPNRRGIILSDGTENILIGGASAAEGNLISGNEISGIFLTNANGSLIQNNLLGTNTDNDDLGPTGIGIILFASQFNECVQNTIAYNGTGITVNYDDLDANNNTNLFSQNAFFCNEDAILITPFLDSTEVQSPPTILSAEAQLISGTADGADLTIELFIDNDCLNSATQGAEYLGATQPDDAGNWTFPRADSLASGTLITATATNALSGTSPFSFQAVVGQPLVDPTVVKNTHDEGSNSFRSAIEYANNHPGPDTIHFQIPGDGPFSIFVGETSSEYLPVLTDDGTVIDATLDTAYYPGKIRIEGDFLGGINSGIGLYLVNCDGCEVYGLLISKFNSGISAEFGSDDLQIGSLEKPNIIASSVLGIALSEYGPGGGIEGNIIGSDPLGEPVGLLTYGINVLSTVDNTPLEIRGNQFSNSIIGIGLLNGTSHVRIHQNTIGLPDCEGTACISTGIEIGFSQFNEVQQNTIQNCQNGILFYGSTEPLENWQNKFSGNIFQCNDQGMVYNGDPLFNVPLIDSLSSEAVQGTGPELATIELYASVSCAALACQGQVYLGSTVADTAGNWTIEAPFESPITQNSRVTALALSDSVLISTFSNCIYSPNPNLLVTSIAPTGEGSLAAAIAFANANPGSDTIRFDLLGNPPFLIQLMENPLALETPNGDSTFIDATSLPGYYPGSIVIDGSNFDEEESGLHIDAAFCIVKGLRFQNFLFAGLGLSENARDCQILENEFSDNSIGIYTLLSTNPPQAGRNVFTQNSFTCNGIGIFFPPQTPEAIRPTVPIIEQAQEDFIAGSSAPGSIIELFSDINCGTAQPQGFRFLGMVQANLTTGDWSFIPPDSIMLNSGNLITATAQDSEKGTSAFSPNAFINYPTDNPTTVTHTEDDGPGSLRVAIEYANSRPGADSIHFELSGDGPFAFFPGASTGGAFPKLSDHGTVLDAKSQEEYYSGILQLYGDSLNNEALSHQGFHLAADSCDLIGFSLNGFETGLLINGNHHLIIDNIFQNCGRGILINNQPESADHTLNQYTGNTFSCNTTAIHFFDPIEANPPLIEFASPGLIQGTAPVNAQVEVYLHQECANSACQGQVYLGTTTSDLNGNWHIPAPFTQDILSGNALTAVALQNNQLISGFSSCFIAMDGTYVTNTDDEGPGSLRAALEWARQQPGPDTIRFNIPGEGPFIIQPVTGFLPVIDHAFTVLDGTTQPNFYPGSIVLEGSLCPFCNLRILAPYCTIKGLTIQNFTIGIRCQSEYCTLTDNIVGGAEIGFDIANDHAEIKGNWIGLDIDGVSAVANDIGIWVSGNNVQIGGPDAGDHNYISGNEQSGITILDDDAIVQNNRIGIDTAGLPLPNLSGIRLDGARAAISDNTIAYNANGVFILPNGEDNLVSRNHFFCNQSAIDHAAETSFLAAPGILSADLATIRGTAMAGASVEVFIDLPCPEDTICQGATYLGTTIANSEGLWMLEAMEFASSIQLGDQITATAKMAGENSSKFSESCIPVTCPLRTANIVEELESLCLGDTLRLNSQISHPQLDIQFSWTDMDGTVLSEEPTLQLPLTSTGPLKITLETRLENCLSVLDSILIQVEALPSVSLPTSITLNCDSLEAQIEVIGADSLIYEWSAPEISYFSIDQSPIIEQPANYTLEILNPASGCENIYIVDAQVDGIFSNFALADTLFCEGDQISIDAGAGFNTYAWSNGETDRFSTFVQGGIYQVAVSGDYNCNGISTFQIVALQAADFDLGIDTSLKAYFAQQTGQGTLPILNLPPYPVEIQIQALSDYGSLNGLPEGQNVQYAFSGGREGIDYPARFTIQINSTLCPHLTDSVDVLVFPNAASDLPFEVFVPKTIYTNQPLKIEGLHHYQKTTLTILNRWQNQVFQADNYREYSDGAMIWRGDSGKALPQGVYYYVLQLVEPNGQQYALRGSIYVLKPQ